MNSLKIENSYIYKLKCIKSIDDNDICYIGSTKN